MSKPNTKVINKGNLPARLPIWRALIAWIAMDHWNAPQWVYGGVAVLFIILSGVVIYRLASTDEVDIFEGK